MSPHFPIGIYAIPEISMVGPTEQDLTRDRVPYETGLARYREIARGQILGDDSGLLKMLFHREDRRLLGVHAIGTGATELIHIGQAVLAHGGGMAYFLQNVFNYPTLAECYKVARARRSPTSFAASRFCRGRSERSGTAEHARRRVPPRRPTAAAPGSTRSWAPRRADRAHAVRAPRRSRGRRPEGRVQARIVAPVAVRAEIRARGGRAFLASRGW